MNTIHFLKPGTWRADDGKVYAFTDKVLSDIAQSYDPSIHEAPIVIGHPKTDAPAYGWIRNIKATGDGLEADPGDELTPRMQQWLSDKLYKKVSPSLYSPEDPSNPTPGRWYLRHIGFLGAKPPAIKGLRQTQFSDQGGILFTEYYDSPGDDPSPIVYAQEGDSMPDNPTTELLDIEKQKAALADKIKLLEDREVAIEAREKALAEKEQAALDESNKGFIKDLKLTPAQSAGLVAFMSQLGAVEKRVSFAEPGQDIAKEESLLDYFKSLMKKLSGEKATPNFGEVTPGATADDLKPDDKPAFLRVIEQDAKRLQDEFQTSRSRGGK